MQNAKLSELLVGAPRRQQQIFLSALIHHLTITARDQYDQPDAATKLSFVNEAIHCLVGHLHQSLVINAPFEDWQIAQIDDLVSRLHPANQAKLAEKLVDSSG